MRISWIMQACLSAATASWMLGCSKSEPMYRASVDVSFLTDASNPEPSATVFSTNWITGHLALVKSEPVLAAVVDELKLAQRWGTAEAVLSREDAVQRLQAAVEVRGEDSIRGFVITVTDADTAMSEEIASAIAKTFRTKVQEEAVKGIQRFIAQREAELSEAQEKLSALGEQLQTLQKELFVPSRYRLSAEYEEELKKQITEARDEENARRQQLEALGKLEGEQLKEALLKLELARVAATRRSTNATDATSMLLTVNQQYKAALNELELAKSGALTETNAVAHAELKIALAATNLMHLMEGQLKSLEIEWDVAKGRRQELEAQLEKLREMSKRAETKNEIERQLKNLNARLGRLTAEIERSRLSLRLLPEAIQIGQPRVVAVQ